MRIAVLSPIAWRTPPRSYGPWEKVASALTEGLVHSGHDVTLFATADSCTGAKLDAVSEHPYEENRAMDTKVWECMHIANLMEKADRFDIIHNHFDFLPLSYSRLIKTPMITTIHGFSSENIVPVYKKYNSNTHYVSISDSNRHPELDYLATVHHGIDSIAFPYCQIKKEYLLFYGRIHPDKGAHLAIAIAKRSNCPLIMAGPIQDSDYYIREVVPHVDGTNVLYLGNVSQRDGASLLGEARALLHPILFEEPFGLSVAEAMMCGTPVIAYKLGSMPELIMDGKTGYLVDDITQAVAAVRRIGELDPGICRAHAIAVFGIDRMVKGYLSCYEKILMAK